MQQGHRCRQAGREGAGKKMNKICDLPFSPTSHDLPALQYLERGAAMVYDDIGHGLEAVFVHFADEMT